MLSPTMQPSAAAKGPPTGEGPYNSFRRWGETMPEMSEMMTLWLCHVIVIENGRFIVSFPIIIVDFD